MDAHTMRYPTLGKTTAATSQEPTFFDPDRFGILYFSRGRGKGHAIPDMAIGNELLRLKDGLELQYASYSLGADAFRSCGYDVIDMQMPDDPDPWDALIKLLRLADQVKPRLIVSHEEPQALIASQVFGIPSLFITDFFQDPTNHWMKPLQAAMEVIFIGEQGYFTEPPYIRGRVRYVGPAVRHFQRGEMGRECAREELNANSDTVVALCQPGNYDEAAVPIYDVLLSAWDALPHASKQLVWLAGRDVEVISSRLAGRTDVTVLAADWNIDRLFAACDLVITKGNRVTVFEAASLGIPSISISNGSNWPDDVAIAKISSNTMLDARAITVEQLLLCMKDKFESDRIPSDRCSDWAGIEGAAERIAQAVNTICGIC